MKKNMKCEQCHEKEANFYYKSVVNGKVTEKHLCSDCAAKLGYMDDVTVSTSLFDLFAPMPAFGGFFGGGLLDSMFDRAFGLMPVRVACMTAPAEAEEETQPAAAQGAGVSAEEAQALKRERELNALHTELRSCVEREDFERAIELRDKIKGLEK